MYSQSFPSKYIHISTDISYWNNNKMFKTHIPYMAEKEVDKNLVGKMQSSNSGRLPYTVVDTFKHRKDKGTGSSYRLMQISKDFKINICQCLVEK